MKAQPVTVYLPDMRGVEISRYGFGNYKIGFGVFTYSRLAGAPQPFAQRAMAREMGLAMRPQGTCPGATVECEAICYAKRISGPNVEQYQRNSITDQVPPIPAECKVLRIHISGDFDSVSYIQQWIARLRERPDVTCWAYTRSWRVRDLLPHLVELRALPNMQLFASMDPTCKELPPIGWRRAWIHRQEPNGEWPMETRLVAPKTTSIYPLKFVKPIEVTTFNSEHSQFVGMPHNLVAVTHETSELICRTPAYVCPEETGRKQDCLACGYCFEGQKHDVVFLEHHGSK